MTDKAAPIRAESLVKSFEAPGGAARFRALDTVSLDVAEGTLTALVGPDGAGKTSFMRMAAGLMKPDGGTLHVLGIDVSRDPQTVQNRISYMPQRFGLYEDLSVQENLDLYADLHGVPEDQRAQRFRRMLEMTDMARFTGRLAGNLSGGMKQKLGLACTLVRSPDLLLLDEPTVGVDPLSRRELWEIVQQLVRDDRLTVLVTTAYLDEAERCARVFVLHEGRLLAAGTPEKLRETARGLTFRAVPPAGVAARTLQARLIDAPEAIIDAVPSGGAVNFIRRDSAAARVAALLAGATAVPRPALLEDAFMMMLRERAQPPAASGAPEEPTPPQEKGEPVVVVRDLVRKFGDFTAVASTSFDVCRGEIFGLLGPNGAGKTTTFRMLCGLLPATSGHLEVAGLNLRKARHQARARIGYVSQKFALYGNLTVRENLEFFGGAYGLGGKTLRERIGAALDGYGLEAEAVSGMLPGGYKQRLAMAAALLHRPEILFLDEPTSGIDPLARRAFWRTITTLAGRGVTIIVTTHFMEEAEYCDRIAIQDAGHVLALGTPDEVRARAGEGRSESMNDAFIAIVEQARANAAAPAAAAA